MKTRSKKYADIRDYLAENKRVLSFTPKDIKIVKSKINEIYTINEIDDLNLQINELQRIKSDLELISTLSKYNTDFAMNTIIYISFLGTLIASVDKIVEMLIEQFNHSYLTAIPLTFIFVSCVTAISILIIAKGTIFPENIRKTNRHVVIYVLDQMIRDKKMSPLYFKEMSDNK